MKCAVCGQKKGKRGCRQRGGADVCPLCCVALRTADQCAGCAHLAQADQYKKERARQGSLPRDFVMRIDPDVEEETDRALQQLEGGRLPEGEAAIRRLYEENPDLSCTQYAMGVLFLVKEDVKEAARYFEQAVVTFPYFAEAHFNLSCCYRQTLQVTKAIRSLMAARDVAQVGGTVHTQAVSLLRDFTDGIEKNEGVDLDTFLRVGDAFDRAFAHMEKGDTQQAAIDFQECIRIKPSAYQAYGNLGICYARLGMKDKAYAMLDKALELNPNYEPAKWNRGAVEALAEGKENVQGLALVYSAARAMEDDERSDTPEGKDRPATGLLGSLRRRFSGG